MTVVAIFASVLLLIDVLPSCYMLSFVYIYPHVYLVRRWNMLIG